LLATFLVLLIHFPSAYADDRADSTTMASSDSLGSVPPDSLEAAFLSALLSPDSAARGRRACRLECAIGAECEGLEQDFGDASLFGGESPTDSAPDDVLEALRVREREADVMGVAEFMLRSGTGTAWRPALFLKARVGENRRAVSADGEFSAPSGWAKGFSIQNAFFWDEQENDDRTAGQDLLYLRWKRRPPGSSRTFSVRGALDLSWASGDSLARLFDYRRASMRLGLSGSGLGYYSCFLDLSRKWVDEGATGAYDAIAAECARGWMRSSTNIDVEVRAERRVYRPGSATSDSADVVSSLGSFWEGEVYSRWRRTFPWLELRSTVRLSGTLYDDQSGGDEIAEEEIGSAYDDRFRAEVDLLLRKELVGGFDINAELGAASGSGFIDALELGIGPTIDLLRLKGAGGDFSACGARVELSAQGGPRLGGFWCDFSLEAGRRNYRGDGSALVFDFQGIDFSLSQTDYTYYRISLIGGGELPLFLEWEAYLSLDQERHTDPADDGRLLSFSIALKRCWCLRR
jgi:hypothetical protein